LAEVRTLDYIVIAAYLIGITLFGIFAGGKQKSERDYFLGASSAPWWAVCFSIVAAETSTLTFISIPGLAYLTNFNFLQVTFGYLIGRIFVAKFFLPAYFKGELSTAYAFLENRFGVKARVFASFVFMFTRVAADGVRLFATAIPLKLLLDIDYPVAVLIIAAVALLYTTFGGVKGIIWVDVIQMFIYIGGALIAIYFLLDKFIPVPFSEILSLPEVKSRLSVINWGFDEGIGGFFKQPYTVIGGLVGGALLSMATHGTDQLIVQRLLTTKDLSKSRKAIIGSGVIVIIQFVIFLFLGVLLFVYYHATDLSSLGISKADEIFPLFIIQRLPSGISGFIIAGLFAAAISTLAGSISSLSSSTVFDLLGSVKNKFFDKNKLLISRWTTLFWSLLLIASALFFMSSPQTVVELALSIASFTYGGLLGTFLLGVFNKKAKQEDAIAAFTAGIFVMLAVVFLKLVAWTWFILIGAGITLLVGTILSRLPNEKTKGTSP